MSTPTAPSTSNAWTWSFPGAPISIKIDFEFISLLRAQIDTDAQVGGVLLGCQGKTPDVLEIRDVAWLPSTSEEQYELDLSLVENLRQASPRVADNGTKLSVVGYFRTQAQGILELRDTEVDLVLKHFSHPNDVVLVIRTSPPQNTAGFFVWYGDVFTPYSFKDFPFDVASLRNDAPTPPAKLPKVVVREPEPVAEPEPAPVHEVWTPAAAPVPVVQARPRRILPIVAASLLVVAGISGYLLRQHLFQAPRAITPAPVATVSLKLQVEEQGNGLNIRWDPTSMPATGVREGQLVISERDQSPLIVNLDPEQLANGHVYYKPATERVGFRLEVVDNAGQMIKESVLALATNSAAVRPVEPATMPAPVPVKNAPITLAKAFAPRVVKAPVPVRQFALPASSAARVETPGTILLDAPAVPTTAPAIAPGPSPTDEPTIILARVLPPAPVPAPTPVASPAPAVVFEAPQPPVPTKRVSPTLARSVASLIQGNRELTVSVNVHLDEAGRIIRAEAVQHDATVPPRLIKDAVDAALQWQFKPARRGSTTIASEYTIRFGFQK